MKDPQHHLLINTQFLAKAISKNFSYILNDKDYLAPKYDFKSSYSINGICDLEETEKLNLPDELFTMGQIEAITSNYWLALFADTDRLIYYVNIYFRANLVQQYKVVFYQ